MIGLFARNLARNDALLQRWKIVVSLRSPLDHNAQYSHEQRECRTHTANTHEISEQAVLGS